jgi:adenosylmethionine-8-amino-7-oxononanoate aminotransferase
VIAKAARAFLNRRVKTHYQYPEGHILVRDFDWQYPVIDRGEGIYLFDKAGRKHIDASGGAFVNALGHGVGEVVDEIAQQMKRVAYVNGKHFTSEAAEAFADKLVSYAPGKLSRVSLLNSGSDATEAALKFALQYWVEKGLKKKNKIIARSPSYHGNTMFSLSVSARPSYKKFYGPYISPILFTSCPYEYRSPVSDYEGVGANHYLAELESLIKKEGPETIAAFILEPMSASSCAASKPPKGYLKGVQEICRYYNILTIGDEVACGAGRTGEFFASKLWDFEPDVAVLGKSVNAGFIPLAVMLVREDHLNEIAEKKSSVLLAHTYLQSPSVAACGLAVINYIEKHKLLANCADVGSYLLNRMRERLMKFPHVGHITGQGMLMALEFVQDKSAKLAFAREKKTIEKISQAAFKKGAVFWGHYGMADGVNGDCWVIAPPYTMSRAQADELVDIMEETISSFSFES